MVTERQLRAALKRLVEEAELLQKAQERAQVAEDAYTNRWSQYVTSNKITGNNDRERRAAETELLSSEANARSGARLGLIRAELWYKVAEQQLEVMKLLYEKGHGGMNNDSS